MACCIIAALILAQIAATLRRWAVFWGLVAPGEHDDPDTIPRRIRQFLARPLVRTAFAALLAVESGLFGAWVYTAHGAHFQHLAEDALARAQGERVVYAPKCAPKPGSAPVRIVVREARP